MNGAYASQAVLTQQTNIKFLSEIMNNNAYLLKKEK